MKAWHVLNLGDAMLAGAALDRIEAQLEAEWARLGQPDDAAAYTRHESEGRLHCELKVYLAPGLRDAAERLGAEPCDEPSRDGLSLLVGTEEAWAVNYPERDG